MPMQSHSSLAKSLACFKKNLQQIATVPDFLNGKNLQIRTNQKIGRLQPPKNPFEKFFYERKKGPGIWKWTHYFQIYEKYLRPLAGKRPTLLEIGVFSGGSLDMWKSVLGARARILGLDVHPACRAYAKSGYEIYIGDQGKMETWHRIFSRIRSLDIVIDDGSHLPHDQRVTFEAVFPRIEPGGVMIFEDVHGEGNRFAAYCRGLAAQLNQVNPLDATFENLRANGVQKYIHAITFYPFAVVFERNLRPRPRLVSLKNGTQWAPFFDPYFKKQAHPQNAS